MHILERGNNLVYLSLHTTRFISIIHLNISSSRYIRRIKTKIGIDYESHIAIFKTIMKLRLQPKFPRNKWHSKRFSFKYYR